MKSYDAYVKQMKATMGPRSVWWFLLAVITGAVIFVVVAGIYGFVIRFFVGSSDAKLALNSGRDAFGMVFILCGLGLMIVAIAATLRIFHKNSIMIMFQPRAAFRNDFCNVFLVIAILVAFAVVGGMFFTGFEQHSTIGRWLLLLPLGVLLVLLQVSAEEIVFRGYFQGQLAAMNMPKWVWMLTPSLLFGFMHYSPSVMGDTAIWYVVWATGFGLIMADLTARTGNLGAAIAIHFANNIGGVIWIGVSDYLNGLTLFVSPFSITDTEKVVQYLPLSAATLILYYVVARYKLGK